MILLFLFQSFSINLVSSALYYLRAGHHESFFPTLFFPDRENLRFASPYFAVGPILFFPLLFCMVRPLPNLYEFSIVAKTQIEVAQMTKKHTPPTKTVVVRRAKRVETVALFRQYFPTYSKDF